MSDILGFAGPDSDWKQTHSNPAVFLAGLWHGLLLPFSFWVSLLYPSVRIYETNNSGRWYDFGFMIGTGTTIATGGSQL